MKRSNDERAIRDERDSYRRSEMEFGVAADAYRSDPSRKATRNGAVMITVSLSIMAFLAVLALWYVISGVLSFAGIVVALIVGLAVLSSVHVCLEWERAVIMRFGRFSRLAGPGIFLSIPLAEFCTLRVDQRTIATPFGAEEALTSDLVPLDVDAVLFWMIWDPEKACTEVQDCHFAVALTAQTALRDAIGRASVSNVVMRRHQLDQELQEAVEAKVTDWGITVLSVEIRDIIIPKELQGVMSLEAQAECRKNARITLMEAERDVSAILQEVAETYTHDEIALSLRKMHLVYEGMQESEGTVVVPSAYSEGFTAESDRESSKS
ncbi:SPFH domain-containing protein [Paraeggerthella sp. Marseille-Q4926]|uniref:SPFH domain-containing protein n=1 Tax=Paraeggerthella sp. Marseille-Q4926 TaxID=2866587 RepID=UPI001CE4B3C7|nr:SPFH domain-containing protein [Paraeggerthella sp. Marseille-Q4926]